VLSLPSPRIDDLQKIYFFPTGRRVGRVDVEISVGVERANDIV